MNDDEERLESLSARLKERQMAEKFKIQDIENKLEQAEAMTLRLLIAVMARQTASKRRG